AVATLCGFVFGLISVLLLDQLDFRVRTPRQLENTIPLQALTMIGELPRRRPGHAADHVLDHPHDLVTEAIRSLRVRLFHQAANDSEAAPQVLGITSSLTGEGKTTTALWLARLLAASGGRVLLVDADLRRPSLQSLLNLRVDASVADALLGRVTLDSLILQDPRIPELSILCGDPPAQSNDIEMLTPQLIENAFIAL